MADVYCPRCGEPWDMYDFHDIARDWDITFQQVYSLFQQFGCGMFNAAWDGMTIASIEACDNELVESVEFVRSVAEVYNLMGTDIDGAVSTIEDFRAMGLF